MQDAYTFNINRVIFSKKFIFLSLYIVRKMKNLLINVLIIFAGFLAAISCTKTGDAETGLKEIILSPFSVQLKANLYDSSKLLSEDKKGNFSVIAYKAGTKTKYFLQPERIYYMYYPDSPEASEWRFYQKDSQGNESFYSRYWPQTYALDFFAYMPYNLESTYVNIDFTSLYVSCNLPEQGEKHDSLNEFIYAFSPDQTYEQSGGSVNLTFIHPFSAIRFKLGDAHGNTTIKTLGFSGLHNQGIFPNPDNYNMAAEQEQLSHEDWKPTGDPDILSASINKHVPNDIQLNSYIGGTYIVMPQTLNGVTLDISYNFETDKTAAISLAGRGSWVPGKVYTYVLNLGNSEEDILVDVLVDQWDIIDYDNEVDVE